MQIAGNEEVVALRPQALTRVNEGDGLVLEDNEGGDELVLEENEENGSDGLAFEENEDGDDLVLEAEMSSGRAMVLSFTTGASFWPRARKKRQGPRT